MHYPHEVNGIIYGSEMGGLVMPNLPEASTSSKGGSIDTAAFNSVGNATLHHYYGEHPTDHLYVEQENGSFVLTVDPSENKEQTEEKFATARLFMRTAKEEMSERPTKEKVIDAGLITVSGIGFGFEQGPWNELAVTNIGREIIERTVEQGNVGLTAISVAGGLAVWSMFEHSVLGAAMARNIERFPRSIQVLSEAKGESDALRNSRDRKLPARWWNAFSIGAASVNIEDSITDPDFVAEKKGYKRALGSAALIAAGSGAIGAAAGAGFQFAINEGHQEIAETGLDVISHPLLWAGGFVIYRVWDYAKKRKARLEREANDTEVTIDPNNVEED